MGPTVKATQIAGETAFIGGVRGGWIMNHSYAVGAGLYFSPNEIDVPDGVSTYEKSNNRNLGYGGLEAEYIGKWDKRIHYTVHSLLGFGGISYGDDENYDDRANEPPYGNEPPDYYSLHLFKSAGESSNGDNDDSRDTDILFVFEPSINIEVNITDKLRFDTGISYRAVAGVDTEGLDNSDISGFCLQLTIKFGRYK